MWADIISKTTKNENNTLTNLWYLKQVCFMNFVWLKCPQGILKQKAVFRDLARVILKFVKECHKELYIRAVKLGVGFCLGTLKLYIENYTVHR